MTAGQCRSRALLVQERESVLASDAGSSVPSVLNLNCQRRGGADKSLARLGRKQATATKLGFIQHTPHEAQYTSYPVALTFERHLKKIQNVVRPTRFQRQE